MTEADRILAAFGMTPPRKPVLGPLRNAPKPRGNEAHWRKQLGGQGNLRAHKPTAGEKIEAGLGGVLGKVVGDKAGRRMATRAMAPLNDLTPVGDALAAAAGVSDIRKGNYASGAGNLLLSAVGSVPGVGDALAGASKAMFLGVLARNADKAKLGRAEQMAGAGADRDAIWNETGWFKGVDDKWRFEIDDSASGLRRDRLEYVPNAGRGYRHGKLADAIEHPELFKAYPDAEDAGFAEYSFSNGGTNGTYHEPGLIGEQVALWNDSGRSTALHETQHLVQGREGFARGGNAEAMKGQIPNPNWDQWNSPDNQAIASEYQALFGSPEYAAERGAWNADWSKTFAPRLDELEAAQDAAGRSGFKDYQPKIDALFAEANQYERANYPTLGRALELSESGIVKEPTRHLDDFTAYHRLAGEVEARNVQKRLDMDMTDRRATPPWMTQDVPDTEQIVRFLTGGK